MSVTPSRPPARRWLKRVHSPPAHDNSSDTAKKKSPQAVKTNPPPGGSQRLNRWRGLRAAKRPRVARFLVRHRDLRGITNRGMLCAELARVVEGCSSKRWAAARLFAKKKPERTQSPESALVDKLFDIKRLRKLSAGLRGCVSSPNEPNSGPFARVAVASRGRPRKVEFEGAGRRVGALDFWGVRIYDGEVFSLRPRRRFDLRRTRRRGSASLEATAARRWTAPTPYSYSPPPEQALRAARGLAAP